MEDQRQERKLTTILSADVVGYSDLMHRDETATLRELKTLRHEVLDPKIKNHRGRTIKLIGDGSLIEFPSVVDAVRFAVDFQHAMMTTQPNTQERDRIRFRIGINVGDIIVDDNDIYGDGVNIAARIEGLADPDGVCVASSVFDHVSGKLDLDLKSMGPQNLKNIPHSIEVYRIEFNEKSQRFTTEIGSIEPVPQNTATATSPALKIWPFLASAMLLTALAAASWFAFFTPEERQPPVIAVLPFQDSSTEQYRGLLGEPISDGILAHLARYPELIVIARGSSFRFRKVDRNIKDIGTQLKAKYIVEGSLRFDGQRVTINAALVEVEKGTQTWSDRIVADVDNLEKVITDVGKRVAKQVEDVVGTEEVSNSKTTNSDALLMMLQARKLSWKGLSKENNAAVIALNRQTLKLHPDAVWGYLAMAFALRTHVRFGWAEDPKAMLAEGIQHGEAAVRLAPDNYSAHFALGRVRLQAGDHLRAIESFETALRLNPSSADTMNALAQAYFYLGKNDRALEILAQSEQIDPLPSRVHTWMLSWVLWQDERCGEAETAFAKMPVPPPAAQKLASVIQTCLGNPEAAHKALQTFVASAPNWTLEKEVEIQSGVWIFDTGRERWLKNLAEAASPDDS